MQFMALALLAVEKITTHQNQNELEVKGMRTGKSQAAETQDELYKGFSLP